MSNRHDCVVKLAEWKLEPLSHDQEARKIDAEADILEMEANRLTPNAIFASVKVRVVTPGEMGLNNKRQCRVAGSRNL